MANIDKIFENIAPNMIDKVDSSGTIKVRVVKRSKK